MSLTRILCQCCGNPLAWCMCWGSVLTDFNTGEMTSRHCKPEDHRKQAG